MLDFILGPGQQTVDRHELQTLPPDPAAPVPAAPSAPPCRAPPDARPTPRPASHRRRPRRREGIVRRPRRRPERRSVARRWKQMEIFEPLGGRGGGVSGVVCRTRDIRRVCLWRNEASTWRLNEQRLDESFTGFGGLAILQAHRIPADLKPMKNRVSHTKTMFFLSKAQVFDMFLMRPWYPLVTSLRFFERGLSESKPLRSTDSKASACPATLARSSKSET